MGFAKDAWETLRAVASVVDKLADLSGEVKSLREENRDLRERLVRIETIIDEARRNAAQRSLPARKG
jgi:regulator of replication initiation timing